MLSPHDLENRQAQALVVLGCRLRQGLPGSALERRLQEALKIHKQNASLPVVMSGGRKWDGRCESTAMGAWWREHQGTAAELYEESESLTTRQNAHYVARWLRTHACTHILLVTCDFHMARASQLFEAQGFSVLARPACHRRSWFQNTKLALREWGARKLISWEPRLR